MPENQSVHSTAGLTYKVSFFIVEEAVVVHSAIQPMHVTRCVCVCVRVVGWGRKGYDSE